MRVLRKKQTRPWTGGRRGRPPLRPSQQALIIPPSVPNIRYKENCAMPEPPSLFEPHMPEVDVLPDMPGLFAKARIEIASGGERRVRIVTPGRMTMLQP